MPSVHTVIDGRYAYAKIFLVFTVSEMGGGGSATIGEKNVD